MMLQFRTRGVPGDTYETEITCAIEGSQTHDDITIQNQRRKPGDTYETDITCVVKGSQS
jgi:hypothetical protein